MGNVQKTQEKLQEQVLDLWMDVGYPKMVYQVEFRRIYGKNRGQMERGGKSIQSLIMGKVGF